MHELPPLSEADCIYVIERRKSEFNFPIHSHTEFEINYVENATGALRVVGDSIEEIGDYDMVLITGQTFGAIAYSRNLCLIMNEKRNKANNESISDRCCRVYRSSVGESPDGQRL